MTTNIKIDEKRNGRHFKQIEFLMPTVKSVLSKTPGVRESFLIDGIAVDKNTFWASYSEVEDRQGGLIVRLSRALEGTDWNRLRALDPNSQEYRIGIESLNLAGLQQIEVELTPEEREIVVQEKANYQYPIGDGDERLYTFMQLAGALTNLFEQQLVSQLKARELSANRRAS